jgi:hypothetical protein
VIEWQGHHSLRFDADPETTAAFLVDVILSHNLKVYTTTESRSRRLVAALRRRLPAEYGVTRRFEYLVIWHCPSFRAHPLAVLAALDPRSFAMLGGRRMFRVARKRLTHVETGRRVRVEVAHAPSGVAAGPGVWSDEFPDRVRISKAGFARWGHRLDRYRRRHPDAVALAHMDSNLDQFRPQWRNLLTHMMGATPSIYDLAGVPETGTHGDRLIDTAHVAGVDVDRVGIVTRSRPPKLDHRPVIYRAAYPQT